MNITLYDIPATVQVHIYLYNNLHWGVRGVRGKRRSCGASRALETSCLPCFRVLQAFSSLASCPNVVPFVLSWLPSSLSHFPNSENWYQAKIPVTFVVCLCDEHIHRSTAWTYAAPTQQGHQAKIPMTDGHPHTKHTHKTYIDTKPKSLWQPGVFMRSVIHECETYAPPKTQRHWCQAKIPIALP